MHAHAEAHLRLNLRRVQAGVMHRAPGIRKCPDCGNAYIKDDAPVPYCRDCRTAHAIKCRDCGTFFDCDTAGTTRCVACQHQESLF